MEAFWADIRLTIAPLKLRILHKDVSRGQPTGREEAFAVYGSRADWEERLEKLVDTGKPVFVRWSEED